MLVEELEHALGIELSDRDEDTVGGVILSELGRGAVVGDKVELGPVILEVIDVHLNRVKRVRAIVNTPQPVSPAEDA